LSRAAKSIRTSGAKNSESSPELDAIIDNVRRNYELLSLAADNIALDGVAALLDVLGLTSGPEFQTEEEWGPEISVLSAVAAAEGLFQDHLVGPRSPRRSVAEWHAYSQRDLILAICLEHSPLSTL